jgi:hypothetical protein
MIASSIKVKGAGSGSGSGSAGRFSFPGEHNTLSGHDNIDFLGVGGSTTFDAERFVPFLPVHRPAESDAAIVAGAEKVKESGDRLETGRVVRRKRKTARSILGNPGLATKFQCIPHFIEFGLTVSNLRKTARNFEENYTCYDNL